MKRSRKVIIYVIIYVVTIFLFLRFLLIDSFDNFATIRSWYVAMYYNFHRQIPIYDTSVGRIFSSTKDYSSFNNNNKIDSTSSNNSNNNNNNNNNSNSNKIQDNNRLRRNYNVNDIRSLIGYLGYGGCIWDIGANDGVWESNSFYLLQRRRYYGFLYEPDANRFLMLRDLYGELDSDGNKKFPRVQLFNVGLSNKNEVSSINILPMGHENTLERYGKRKQYDRANYQYHIGLFNSSIICQQQKEMLSKKLCYIKPSKRMTILSIDCEGSDADVLIAAHTNTDCHWDIVIIESIDYAGHLMKKYKYLGKVGYNHVFQWKDS